MGILLTILAIVCGIISLVCFIMVVIQMFQHGQTGLGVACLVLILCGIGGLIAFIVGWINSASWGIKNIMLLWTAAIVLGLIFNIAGGGFQMAQLNMR